ncbi:MAG: hypothetical protein O3B01_27060 [Planctomycetota bacterium]|nr:hypothetical protein [Planctomycetota bacterium]
MAKIKREANSLEAIRGGGFVALMGMISFVAGIVMLVIAFREKKPVLFIPTILFGIPGLFLLLGRIGTKIDLQHQQVIRWHGLLIPMFRRTYSLDDFEYVGVTRASSDENNSSFVYPVFLRRKETVEEKARNEKLASALLHLRNLNFQIDRDYLSARRMAESIARMLGMELHDDSSGAMIIRSPGEFDETLRDRLKKRGVPEGLPQAPEKARVRVLTDGTSMTFEFPEPGFQAVHFLIMVMSLGFWVTAVGMAFFMKSSLTISGSGGILIGFFSLFGLLPFIFTFLVSRKFARTQEILTLTGDGDVILERRYMSSKSTTIPANELEELFTRPPDHQPVLGMNLSKIHARSDQATLEFGIGSSAEELDWLIAVIEYRVVTTG